MGYWIDSITKRWVWFGMLIKLLDTCAPNVSATKFTYRYRFVMLCTQQTTYRRTASMFLFQWVFLRVKDVKIGKSSKDKSVYSADVFNMSMADGNLFNRNKTWKKIYIFFPTN